MKALSPGNSNKGAPPAAIRLSIHLQHYAGHMTLLRAFCRNTTDEWRRLNVAPRDDDESATPFQRVHSA